MADSGGKRLFLDANVLISGLRFMGPPHQLLVLAESLHVQVLATDYVLQEVRRVLRAKFALSAADVESGMSDLPVTAIPDPPWAQLVRARALLADLADAPILAAALSAKADALVTGDAHFFTPAIQALVPVLTPREALDLLRRPSSGDTRP